MGIIQVANTIVSDPVTVSVSVTLVVSLLVAGGAFIFTGSLGNPMFVVILITMPFLAATGWEQIPGWPNCTPD